MKKKLLIILLGMFLVAGVNAQQNMIVKHWTDGQDISGTWFNNGITASAAVVKCGESDSAYAEYNITAEAEDNILNRNWWYDFTFDMAAEEWEGMNQNLYFSGWISALDGINAEDSIELLFAITSTVGGTNAERGWPTQWVTLPANTWVWFSIDMNQKTFDGGTTPKDMTGATKFKVAPQPKAGVYDLSTGTYKVAYQDLTLSDGPLPEPLEGASPCSAGDDPGTSVKQTSIASANLFYPNPAKSIINFNKLSSGQITNLSGQVVSIFTNTNSLNLKNIPAGIYFVKANNSVSKLIVK